MRVLSTAIVFLLGVSTAMVSGYEPQKEIMLWPKGMPEPKVQTEMPEASIKGKDGISRRSNVSNPRLIVFKPEAGSKASKAAVIVVPGGGFGILADEHEGSDACKWLAKNGITAFQLVHRTPTNKHSEPHAGPVQDLQKAIIEVRNNGTDLNIDTDKIGVLGFSAGGQVTLIAATNKPNFPIVDDKANHKPDFLLLLYPYKIYDPMTKKLRSDIKVENGLPTSFIAQASDDTGSLPQGSTLLFLELINKKIPAELHIYERGGHGFGMNLRPGTTGPGDWQKRAFDWLSQHKLLLQP